MISATDEMRLLERCVRIGKVALVAPAGTMTTGGRSASRLKKSPEFDSWTVAPPAGAGPERVTVPVAGFPDVTVAGLSVKDDTCGRAVVGGVGEGVMESVWMTKLAGCGLEALAVIDALVGAERNGLA